MEAATNRPSVGRAEVKHEGAPMAVEVLGLDHIYIAASDLAKSTAFYDDVMKLLGFRKGTDPVGGTPHIHYFNRVLQYTLRPAERNGCQYTINMRQFYIF